MSFLISLGKRGYLPLGYWVRQISILTCISQGFNTFVFGPVGPVFAEMFGLECLESMSLLPMICLHLYFNFIYRRNPLPSPLEWTDQGIGLITLSWIRSIRKSCFNQTPSRPKICWAGFFAQLYEKSKNGEIDQTQLKKDLATFLYTGLL